MFPVKLCVKGKKELEKTLVLNAVGNWSLIGLESTGIATPAMLLI